MGVFPSGQRGQTVNLLAPPSVVRIHPLPPNKRDLRKQVFFCLCLCPQDTTSFCNFSCKLHFGFYRTSFRLRTQNEVVLRQTVLHLCGVNDVLPSAKTMLRLRRKHLSKAQGCCTSCKRMIYLP